jgi:hypothetical protein
MYCPDDFFDVHRSQRGSIEKAHSLDTPYSDLYKGYSSTTVVALKFVRHVDTDYQEIGRIQTVGKHISYLLSPNGFQ